MEQIPNKSPQGQFGSFSTAAPPYPPPFPPIPPPPLHTFTTLKLSGCFLGGFLFVSGFAAAFVLLVCASAYLIGAGLDSTGESLSIDKKLECQLISEGEGEGIIAVVDIKGVIARQIPNGTSAEKMVKLLKTISENENVKAIVLDMDSPGGEVTAADEIHQALMLCRKKRQLPIVTCMHSMGASGGYYIATATDWIVANRMTMTGSIGVIMSSYNMKGLGDKIGIQPVVYKSGAMKDVLSPFRDSTPEEKRYLQEMINETFHEFASVVAQGRNGQFKDAQSVKKAFFADGRVLSGLQAKKAGLVDQLGTLGDAIDKATKLSGEHSPDVIRYSLSRDFMSILLETRSNSSVNVRVSGLPKITLEPGRMYFLAPESVATWK